MLTKNFQWSAKACITTCEDVSHCHRLTKRGGTIGNRTFGYRSSEHTGQEAEEKEGYDR
jgi:hypothetical protein